MHENSFTVIRVIIRTNISVLGMKKKKFKNKNILQRYYISRRTCSIPTSYNIIILCMYEVYCTYELHAYGYNIICALSPTPTA